MGCGKVLVVGQESYLRSEVPCLSSTPTVFPRPSGVEWSVTNGGRPRSILLPQLVEPPTRRPSNGEPGGTFTSPPGFLRTGSQTRTRPDPPSPATDPLRAVE